MKGKDNKRGKGRGVEWRGVEERGGKGKGKEREKGTVKGLQPPKFGTLSTPLLRDDAIHKQWCERFITA
jgi:hypothetical protein